MTRQQAVPSPAFADAGKGLDTVQKRDRAKDIEQARQAGVMVGVAATCAGVIVAVIGFLMLLVTMLGFGAAAGLLAALVTYAGLRRKR